MYYKTWQPDFEGFYESKYQFDFDDIEYGLFNDPDNINGDYLTWLFENIHDYIDYGRYENDVSKFYVETWFELADFDFVRNVKFESLYSPKEYNFSTNSINIQVNLNFRKLVKAFKTHPESAEYIQNHYTSYDGFMSHYSNDPDLWLETVKRDSEHKIGAMLACIGDVNEWEIYERFRSEINLSEYIKYDELIAAFNEEFSTDITELETLENPFLENIYS